MAAISTNNKNLNIFSLVSKQKIHDDLFKKYEEREEYIAKLEELLKRHNIELSEIELLNPVHRDGDKPIDEKPEFTLTDTPEGGLQNILEKQRQYIRANDFTVEFHNLTFKVKVAAKREVSSIYTVLKSILFFWTNFEAKNDLHILSKLTGRISPSKITLLIGPPGSGKSVLMKALGGRLHASNGATLEGEVFYDGDNINSGKFLPPKVSTYIEQGDTLEAALTVEETLKFAWRCVSGGHHGYDRAKDAASLELLNKDDSNFVLIKNILKVLGLVGCKDTFVGNGMIRGVSGGQKRRVTLGEMVCATRPIAFMDSISNGLDAATTYDIVHSVSQINKTFGTTVLMSLLQPTPDVFNLFDEVMILSEGQIVYHGPRSSVVKYFSDLGYACPGQVDVADFLQEIPTPQGRRFLRDQNKPHNTESLADAWKMSPLHLDLMNDMKFIKLSTIHDLELGANKPTTAITPREWPMEKNIQFPHGFWYYFHLNLDRSTKIMLRNRPFLIGRLAQSCLVGGITGSLFSNIATTDITTMNGFLFNTVMYGAVSNFAIIPMVYEQKAVFYKHSEAMFYPTAAFALTQGITLFPLQCIETILYITIVYWSAGLSDENNGGRFLTYIIVALTFAMVIGQFFRLVSAMIADQNKALPIAGISIVIMVLFSGFIQPKSLISNGWIWFYWMNPMAWALKSVSVNEFKSSKYDFLICTNALCDPMQRYGDVILENYGNPTDEHYIWYSFAVVLGEYLLLFFSTFLALKYLRTQPTPPPPIRERFLETPTVPPKNTSSKGSSKGSVKGSSSMKYELASTTDAKEKEDTVQPVQESEDTASNEHDNYVKLPFDEVSLAFHNIWYTVTLPNGDDVDLLQGVDGFFEPGSMTALMGSSGAGKTTLLDVLAGRKNTGVIKGDMYLNGVLKNDSYFRKIMGYVEQFDSLPQKSTAREAIAFSAALRLDATIDITERNQWVDAVLDMLDLFPLANELIGAMEEGGMSFEQRKRVSIGVELAANPSILFLDEPTTGLDSRAAQSLIRNIRRIATSGRSIVCTIHQPSTAIFNAFDSLLLLRRGGQTVFFGPLGEHSSTLVSFFENSPSVSKIPVNMNPATWMLDIIGAGTASTKPSTTNSSTSPSSGSDMISVSKHGSASNLIKERFLEVDYHKFYLSSTLCELNMLQLERLMTENEGSKRVADASMRMQPSGKWFGHNSTTAEDSQDEYKTTSWAQFVWLMHRIAMTYWRSPSYSLARMGVNILLALIFASAYPLQEYTTAVATVSRASVIFITTMFGGILSLITVIPIMTAERTVFYREQQSRMYRVEIFTLTTVLVEIPYIILTALSFTLPFFYIVGFDNVGEKVGKFFWYWFILALHQATMLFLGQFLVCLTPSEMATQVLSGLLNTLFSLFCGFLITQQSFPTFWLFMYWLNPLHYSLEGLIMAMFHKDDTMITNMQGTPMTAETYMTQYQYTTWAYVHVGLDVLALGLFITCFTVGKYLCLRYLRHDQR